MHTSSNHGPRASTHQRLEAPASKHNAAGRYSRRPGSYCKHVSQRHKQACTTKRKRKRKQALQAGSTSRHCERALRAVTLQQPDIPSSHHRQAHIGVMPGLAIMSHVRLYKQAGSYCKHVSQRHKQACSTKRKRKQALQAGSASRHTATPRHPKLAPQADTQTREARACIHQAIMSHEQVFTRDCKHPRQTQLANTLQ